MGGYRILDAVSTLQKGNKITTEATLFLSLLLIVGMFLPTSMDFSMSNSMKQFNLWLVLGFYMYFFLRTRSINQKYIAVAFGICAFLTIFSFTSPFGNIALGNFYVFFLIGLMFCLDLRNIKVSHQISKVFAAVNIINIIFGIAVISHFEPLTHFLLKYYAYYFDWLLPWMMADGKPVLWFGPHSTAGFFIYLLFYLCLQTYLIKNSKLNLIFAIAYIVLLFNLKSATGSVFFLLSLINIIYYLIAKKRFLILYLTTLTILILVWANMDEVGSMVADAQKMITGRIFSQSSGFVGRYSPDQGNMAANYEYIKSHPFSPIGASFDDSLAIMDSGFIIVWLRGSIFLILLIYGSLFFSLKKQLIDKKTAIWLFFVTLSFEAGVFNLTYFRTFYLIPFAIMYLNYLHKTESSAEEEQRVSPMYFEKAIISVKG